MHSFLSFAFLAGAAVASSSSSPFIIAPLSTHQPNGAADGDTDYYNIQFTVNSTNAGSDFSGTCSNSWGDNGSQNQEAYSVNVPTGEWIACSGSGEFAFQLYPYFSIGNFTLGIQQNFTDTDGNKMTAEGTMHVTNTTSQYTCQILGDETSALSGIGQHARGDCSIPSNGTAFDMDITSTTEADVCTGNVTVSFEAAYTTTYGQNILLVGSIPELGNWDPADAIVMTGHYNYKAWPTFTAEVEIPAGTDFEYKYIFQNTTGAETWEAGDNRSGSLPSYTCAATTVGGTPDDFRTGGTAAN